MSSISSRKHVVDQQSYPDTAVGGPDDPLQKQAAAVVPVPKVVHEIQRGDCRVDQDQAPAQGVGIPVQQPETGLVGAV
jgi:hypothetical protein